MDDAELQLVDDIGAFAYDPLGYVLYAFADEWEQQGAGPRAFQRQALERIGAHLQNPETRFQPLRIAISSGHGIGKTALLGLVVSWGLSTCEDCRVTVMAATGDQLSTKTAPEISKWVRKSINGHWWEINATSIKVKDPAHAQQWRADFLTWSEENPQATAGLHNQGKRIIIIFDEASGIADNVYETVEGALTDANTEIIWLVMSQQTQREGRFAECFTKFAHRWHGEIIDSRDVEGTNKQLFEEQLQDWGEDSDFFRVRVRGLPPRTGDVQFIDFDRVHEAQKRICKASAQDPLIVGVDLAWGGPDHNTIRFRCGLDAKSIRPIRIPGEKTRDRKVMVTALADVLSSTYDGRKVDHMFVDSAGIAGSVVYDLRTLGFKNVTEVNFGADSPDPHCLNWRSYMWSKMRDWLPMGAIDNDSNLQADLTAPGYRRNNRTQLVLEDKEQIKKRLGHSTDDGDALALTFAQPVAPTAKPKPQGFKSHGGPWSR